MRIAMNTKIYKLIAVTACWFLSMGATMAQETKTVSGVVTDAATGQPLAGVIVEAYGNNRFTALTDDKGAYELKVPNYVSSVSMRVEGYQILQKAIGANKADGKLYQPSSGGGTSLKGLRAYFTFPTTLARPVVSIANDDGSTTDIAPTAINVGPSTEAVYSMDGRLVVSPKSGSIYIVRQADGTIRKVTIR